MSDYISSKSLVSVIIPAFNRQHCLPSAIKTVQDQTHHNLEIIVVDDGSSDLTGDLAEWMQKDEPRLRVLRHETNRGVSAARNTGIAAAQGDCIAFLDSDDVWVPEKIQMQISALASLPAERMHKTFSLSYFKRRLGNGRLSVDNIFIGRHQRNAAGELTRVDPRIYRPDELERGALTWRLWFGNGSTLLAHRDAIEANGGFLERTGFGEDTEYVVRHLVKGGKIQVVPEFLMGYLHPAAEKTYAGQADHHRYMIETYASAVAQRWGVDVAAEFVGNLNSDRDARAAFVDDLHVAGKASYVVDEAKLSRDSVSVLAPHRSKVIRRTIAARKMRL